MFDKKRDRVALILAKMKGPSRKGDDYSEPAPGRKPHRESEDYSEGTGVSGKHSLNVGLESAADDVLSAIDRGDSAALVSALTDFLHIHAQECDDCSSDSSDDSDEEDPLEEE